MSIPILIINLTYTSIPQISRGHVCNHMSYSSMKIPTQPEAGVFAVTYSKRGCVSLHCSSVVGYAPRGVTGIPRHLIGTPALVTSPPRCSQIHADCTPALARILKCVTIPRSGLLYNSSDIPVPMKAGQNALLWSETLRQLMSLGLHSTWLLTVQEAPSDYDTFSLRT